MTPDGILFIAYGLGALGLVGLALMMWAKLLDPEQINLTEWDEDDPDRLM